MERKIQLKNRFARKIQIAPSILGADFARLGDIAQKLKLAGADMLHIDVMDGMFVPNISFGPCVIRSLANCVDLPLDVHMMVHQPERYINDVVEAGATHITVHMEATPHIHRVIQSIRAFEHITAGIAINPGTPVEALSCILPDVDLVLIMTVNPGFGGQKLIPFTLDKVQKMRHMLDEIESYALLEVDGGVYPANAHEFTRRGADVLVSGASILNAEDYRIPMDQMRNQP